MATAYISTNTELSLVNTITQNLTLFLPQDPPNGKNLFVKDAAGNSQNSTITLRTQGTNIFEDGSVFQTLNSAYESMQLNYNSNIWYFTGGTMLNTLRVSTIQANTTVLSNLSSANISVSSFQISDSLTSTIGTFNTVSSFLLYNGFNIGGGLRTAIPQTLTNYTQGLIFNPNSISNLSYWFDASVSSSMVVDSASTVLTWYSISTVSTGPSNIRNVLTMRGAPTSNRGLYAPNSLNGLGGVNLSTTFISTATLTNQAQNLYYTNSPTNNSEFTNICLINRFGGLPIHFVQLGGNWRAGLDATLFNYIVESGITTDRQNLGGFNTLCNTPSILVTTRNGGTNTVRLNGISFSSNYYNLSFGTRNFWFMFGTNSYNQYFQGNLHEFIQYQRALTSNEIFQIEGYVAWKWSIVTSLPLSHPYRWVPPF